MKHEDDENIYETNCEILKTCPPVMKSLKQNWVKKDLNLCIMYK